MTWAHYTFLGLVLVELGMVLAKHGEPKTGNYNVWASAISLALYVWLLYEAGFFRAVA